MASIQPCTLEVRLARTNGWLLARPGGLDSWGLEGVEGVHCCGGSGEVMTEFQPYTCRLSCVVALFFSTLGLHAHSILQYLYGTVE